VSGDSAPRIPNFGTRWRSVLSSTTRPLCPPGNEPSARRLGGPQGRSGHGAGENITLPWPCRECNTSRPAHSLVTALSYHSSSDLLVYMAIWRVSRRRVGRQRDNVIPNKTNSNPRAANHPRYTASVKRLWVKGLQVMVLWVETPCCDVVRYQCSGGPWCHTMRNGRRVWK
jgi:hypothetical protein